MTTSSYPDTRLLIANEWVDATGGKTIDVRNPATGQAIGKVAHASKADLDRALDASLFTIFSINGERCTAGSRIFVQESVYDDFVRKFAERAKRRIERHRVESRLDPAKTLECFEFSTVPMVSKAHVMALATGDAWLEKGATVLLFGHPSSPLAQPRNLLLGNGVAALLAVLCVHWLGSTPLAMGLAVGLAIAAGQQLRCLHPPAGAIALLGVLLQARPIFVLLPVLLGSLLLLLCAVVFHRLTPATGSYPHHWL